MCCPPGSLIICLSGDTTFPDCQSWCSTMRVSLSGRWVGGLPSESGDLGGHVSAPLSWLILLKVRLPWRCKLCWQSFIFLILTRGKLLYNVALDFCHTAMRISHNGTCLLSLPSLPPSQPSRSSRDTGLGFLCHMVTSHQLSVLHVTVPYITAEGDYSHEIKRRLLLRKKVMTNVDSTLKSRDITLPTKVHLVRLWFFQWSCVDVRVGL